MKLFDKIRERFPTLFKQKELKLEWAVITKGKKGYDLNRGDGTYLGTFKRKWEATHVAEAEGLLLFDD